MWLNLTQVNDIFFKTRDYKTQHNNHHLRDNLNAGKGKGKCKGKAVPLQAWGGPEGFRKLRFPNFLTTAQDGGKVVSLTHRPHLPPGNTPGTHFC
jgi:hypothetical protein